MMHRHVFMSRVARCARARAIGFVAVFGVTALAACVAPAVQAPSASAALVRATPQQMVAAVHAAGGEDNLELAVQPLRDPRVEDLRERAQREQAQRQYAESAASLDQALTIVTDDPALLQERAEAALLLEDYPGAERYARRGLEIGSGVGPLCRRHWATIEQIRLHAGDAAGAADAKVQIDGCRVAGVNRY